jgi:hypothetical protein|tara:strand:+ start:699 stop:983 length:285 start_codon:yes stop_codon:yes gene_type:complete
MKKLSNLKLTVGNEALYFDMDEFLNQIQMPNKEDKNAMDINLPKFEFFKLLLDTTCNIVEDVDENLGVVSLNKLSIPYKLSLNTLIKYKIIKKL